MKSLEVTDEKAQIAFGRFDSVLNGCLHSCSKQKRKSPLLSADAVICYKDCLKIGGNTLQSLDKHLTAVYTQFFN